MLECRFMRRLETLVASLGVGLALWIVVTTVNLARVGWAPIPIVNDWDRWAAFLADHYSPWFFFQQHYDHRLVAPKLLFAVDHWLFHARGWFLLICSFCFQALTGTLLWRLAGAAYRQSGTERWMQAAVVASCLFSGQQWINFVLPFQVQFIMVYCAAAAALVALWKSAASADFAQGERSTVWMAASIALATVDTYSMANGVLIWPVLILAAVWLRMTWRRIGALAAGAILIGGSYFYHWHNAFPTAHSPLAVRLWHAVVFTLTHMGLPLAPLAAPVAYFKLHDYAAIPGTVLAVALGIGLVMLWRRRESYNSARATLLFFCLFIAGSSASIAYGRSGEGLSAAFEWRYYTPSYILWAAMLLANWPVLRRVPRTMLYGTLCAAILAGIAVNQSNALETVTWWVSTIHLAEIGLVDNVLGSCGDDISDPWRHLYSDCEPSRVVALGNAVDYLRDHRLTVFSEEWTRWVGVPLNSRFAVDRTPGRCQGEFEQTREMVLPVRPGWQASGWAWDNQAGRAPRYVVLGDDRGLVSGIALTGFPPSAVLAALSPRYATATWNGYVNGKRRLITAYVLESDNRSLCAIGTQRLERSSRAVAFTELGARLPDSTPEIAGAWVPDGYFKGLGGPGAPSTDGRVFGSFPDANTGSIRLGPFHLDGHTDLAIPLVTGPVNHGLSILVRDAVSKEIFAQMTPPAVRVAWWVWAPELPVGRELDVEVFAEDKGSGWGEWLALGWPHALRQ